MRSPWHPALPEAGRCEAADEHGPGPVRCNALFGGSLSGLLQPRVVEHQAHSPKGDPITADKPLLTNLP